MISLIADEKTEGVIEGVIEGAIEGTIEGAIEGPTRRVKEKLVILLKAIAENEGKRVPDYVIITKMSRSSVERYIKQLREADLIYFSDKTLVGGYYLTSYIKQKLSEELQ